MHFRSGVAIRLWASLSTLAALAVSASLIGFFAVDRGNEAFRLTVTEDLPDMVSTLQLAQEAASLTASAPALLLATSQPLRRDAMARINDRVAGLNALAAQLPANDVTSDTITYVVQQEKSLVENLKALDRQVSERIDLDKTIAEATTRLGGLELAIERAVMAEPAGVAVREWQVTTQSVMLLMALAASIATPAELTSIQYRIDGLVEVAGRLMAELPADSAARLKPLQQKFELEAVGDVGIPALRALRLAAVRQIKSLMNRNKVLSDEMVALVGSVSSSLEGRALRRSAEIGRTGDHLSAVLLIIAVICVSGALVVIFYINSHVVRRLRDLVVCMQGVVKGSQGLMIPVHSNDEIGQLGLAFEHFVNTIGTRESALQDSERRLADIINLLPDATMVIDSEGRVQFWNRAMEAMTGVAAADMLGKGDYEYALPFYGARRPILIDMVLRSDAFIPGAYSQFECRGDTIWAETTITADQGRPVFLRGSASVLRDSEGKAVGAIETIFDITERCEMMADLLKSKDAAEQANQAKSLFLATMSHELRTPLNSIIGFTDFVKTESFGPVGDPQYLEHADYAGQSAHHLLDMINGMLDLSKIEAGMMKLERARVEVAPLLRRSVRMVHDLALHAGVTIKVAVPSNVPDLWVDERAARQILVNLLGNAIKFNVDGGSILVTALEAGHFIDMVVADTGAGIASDDIPRVLKPFEQIDNRYSRAGGGTGLGLSIVERLVNLHGGTVDIASEVGRGTAVTVRFPSMSGCDTDVIGG
ncbi:MAG: ATP-binding protein [Rhodospirillaceae bacterium]